MNMKAPARTVLGATRRDSITVVVVVVVVGWLCVRFELYEALFDATRRWEFLQLDELPAILGVLAVALTWFAWRRYREASAELTQRRATEAQLAVLLRENRRLGQQYVQAQEDERKRLARELHDEAGQYLNAIKTHAVDIQSRCAPGPEPIHRAATAIVEHTDRAYDAIRNLIRELRPVGLDELGLRAALEHYVEQWQQRLPAVAIDIVLSGELDHLGEQLSLTIYRLTQEGLSNVARHAEAQRVSLRVSRLRSSTVDAVIFLVADDGCGANVDLEHTGMGLIGMRERTEMLGGEFAARSVPGQGFRVEARIPIVELRAEA